MNDFDDLDELEQTFGPSLQVALRRAAEEITDERPPIDALHDDVALAAARPPGRSPWRAVAVAAAVALIVATGVTVTRNRDRGTDVTTSPDPTAVTTSPSPTEVFPDLPPDATVALPPGPISALAGPGGIWTGTELIVWGEPSAPDASPPREGAAFSPEAGTWRVIAPAPIQVGAVVAWTGSEIIVWDGHSAVGAAYDPEADTWRRLPQAPMASGEAATAVWTGNEVIVLSDRRNRRDGPTVDAAAYDPAADEWRALAETNGDLTPFVAPIVATESASQSVWTGTTVLTILDVSDPANDGSARGLARYDLSTDTWHIDADVHYASLVGVPDPDGVTRTVLAMPVEPGGPVDVLDAAGNRIGSLPAHPVDLLGSITDATPAFWLGEEAVFWIGGADWVVSRAEPWALDPTTGTWRPLPAGVTSYQGEGTSVAVGDVLLVSDGAGGIAYRAPT